MRKLILATRNKGKAKEIRFLLKGLPLEIYTLDALGKPPVVEEDQPTFWGNARKKAQTICNFCQEMVLADDLGLEVDILGGYPGVHSARFAGEGAGDEANNRKLLFLLNGISQNKRTARFRCAVAVAAPGRETMVVEGSCEGHIAFTPRGTSGFGYDPLFIYEPEGQTFAELGESVKNQISHRARALQLAKAEIEKIINKA